MMKIVNKEILSDALGIKVVKLEVEAPDIASKAKLCSYDKGDVVFHQEDEADAFYMVRYGNL